MFAGGSHGTLGLGLGVGVGSYAVPENAEIMRAHWRASGQEVGASQVPSGRVNIPRAQLHKGLPWSVDIGLGLGQEPVSKASLVSAYAQWTIYEAFAMPALAIRGGFNRIMALATTDASSMTGDVIASYGFLRLFTVYGSIGSARDQIKVRSGDEYGTSLSLTGSADNSINRVDVRATRSVGAQIQILPPFCLIGFESRTTGNGPASYLAKISVGM